MGKGIWIGTALAAAALLLGALSLAPRGAEASSPQGALRPTLVAVVDTGADLSHPAIAPVLWSNPAERLDGRDDDGNGIVDDVHGADFVTGDGDPGDEHGHGTHTTGTVATAGAPVMVLRALDASANGTEAAVAAAIDYAVRHGATIVNLSLNTDAQDPALEAAIERADEAGVTVVAAAGNDGRDLDAQPSFPICSQRDNVVGVGAAGADFSGHGSCVDRTAPGTEVAGAAPGGGTQVLSGTSQAAAQVAAELARAA